MKIISYLSNLMIPFLLFYVIGCGLLSKRDIYGDFLDGAKDGLKTAVEILPFMIGIYIAVNGLTVSGFLDFIYIVFEPAFRLARIPVEILPLIFLRAISGSGSFIILQNILEIAGPDSFAGRAACSMSGGCETVIYVLALYFGVTHVKKMRHALAGGLIGYFTGIAVSLVICSIL